MFDYSYFETITQGEERLRYLKKCIVTADYRGNTADALDLRYKYIKESVFNGDSFSALIMFPEYMSLFNANEELHSALSFMTAFRWIMEEISGYYQVSAKKVSEYFEKYKEYLSRFGYTLKSYYMLRSRYLMLYRPEEINENLKLYRECSTDDLSDCIACELDAEIRAELLAGSEEKAVRLLSSMMQRNISCPDVPRKTFGSFVDHFTRIGDLDEADYYADLLIPMLNVSPDSLAEAGHVLLLKSYTAPNSAYSIFCRYLDVFIRSKNPGMKFSFAKGAAGFFENINRDENELITMKLPRTFELFNEENQYDPDIMFDYFHCIASDIAEKFDKSTGTTYYTDILNYEYPSEPLKELSLPEHGTIERLPFSVAVPYESEDDVPSSEEIIDRLRLVPDIEFNDISASDKGTIILCGFNSFIGTGFICRINVCEPEDLDEYHPVHRLPDETVENVINGCRATLVISTLFHKGTENAEATALFQFADVINSHSPVILCVTNGTILSSDWVHFHAQGRLPLFDKYMYSVHAYPSIYDESKFDVITTGLAQQASRDLTVLGVEEEDLEFIHLVVSQIADLICGFTELRDEGCTTGFGVVYNEESEVQFSWLPMEKAYPDNFTRSENDLAVPILYLSADDVEFDKGFLIDEIPAEIRHKFDFRASLKSLRIESVLAQRNLPYAFDALEKYPDSELIIGITVYPEEDEEIDDDDEDMSDEICIRAVCIDTDAGTVTGEVVVESNLSPEYKADNLATLSIENVIFWRFENNGTFISSDETYLLLK